MLGRLVKSAGLWVGVLVIAVIAVGVSASVEYWSWLQSETDNTGNTAAIRNIALVVGGTVAILIALWRSLVAERQAAAAQRQSETSERAYLSERYRQAASMLGDRELPVRLGGIFSLERLSEDHPSEFRHEAIKLLVEFVRTPPSLEKPQPNVWDGWLHIERPATREDVQVAITAIAEMLQVDATQKKQEPVHLDLHNAQLCGVELNLPPCRVNLQHADLRYAKLEHLDLTGAQLQWADCRHARFNDSNLFNANMTNADFSKVRAYGTCFVGATMPRRMVDAVLEKADMKSAKFPNTDLTGAELRNANLSGAQLSGGFHWIDQTGAYSAIDGAVRISQDQLDAAVADPEQPPRLSAHPVGDAEPREQLVWRGKAPPSDSTDSA